MFVLKVQVENDDGTEGSTYYEPIQGIGLSAVTKRIEDILSYENVVELTLREICEETDDAPGQGALKRLFGSAR